MSPFGRVTPEEVLVGIVGGILASFVVLFIAAGLTLVLT